MALASINEVALLDLATLEEWTAELIYVGGCIRRWFTCLQTVTHPLTYSPNVSEVEYH